MIKLINNNNITGKTIDLSATNTCKIRRKQWGIIYFNKKTSAKSTKKQIIITTK